MSNLLTLNSLTWSVETDVILDKVSFNVAQGDILGIIGPNGAGKTSLLKCLLNQHKNWQGRINLKNKCINDYKAHELAKIFALVVQNSPALFELSVYDVVSMGLLPYKALFSRDNEADKQEIAFALEKVGLSKSQDQYFNTLSGGEQQRVLIAKALVQKAEILVLDEPTNHLDIFYQHQILQLVKALNITVIMTIHDLNLAAQYCTRLLLLNKGKLVSDDNVDNVLDPHTLSQVFGLPCCRDDEKQEQHSSNNPIPRVYFYPETQSIPWHKPDDVGKV